MKKIISIMLVLVFLISLFTPFAFATGTKPDIDIHSNYALLVNTDTGKIVYEHNAYEKAYPASLTKIMTAIVALENTPNLDAVEVTAKAYVFNEFVGIGVSNAEIQRGESFTMRELLYALMLNSACEAANIIADHVGQGSIPDFVEMMNKKAKEIGANNTNFANAHGLFDENNYTTAYDMYLIASYAASLPGFMDICSTKNYVIEASSERGQKNLIHTNKMLFTTNAYYMPQIRGIKTGTLEEAGRCLVTVAEHNGYNYMCVVMGSTYSDNTSHYKTTKNLYTWAFDNLMLKTLLEDTKSVSEVKVDLSSEKEYVLVRPSKRIAEMVDVNIDPSSVITKINLPEKVNAPVKEGDVLGNVTVILMGEEVATVDLVAMHDVKRSGLKYIGHVFGLVMKKPGFIIGSIVFVALVVFYGVLSVMYNNYKRRHRHYSRYR